MLVKKDLRLIFLSKVFFDHSKIALSKSLPPRYLFPVKILIVNDFGEISSRDKSKVPPPKSQTKKIIIVTIRI